MFWNAEVGMRNVLECGLRNADCGMRNERARTMGRFQVTPDRDFQILNPAKVVGEAQVSVIL